MRLHPGPRPSSCPWWGRLWLLPPVVVVATVLGYVGVVCAAEEAAWAGMAALVVFAVVVVVAADRYADARARARARARLGRR